MNNEINKVILLKYGEVVLKGLNRKHFEAILEKDAVRRLEKCGNYSVKSAQSTLYVTPMDDEALMNIEYTAEQCAKIFGVVSVSVALELEKDMDKILEVGRLCQGSQGRCQNLQGHRQEKRQEIPVTKP